MTDNTPTQAGSSAKSIQNPYSGHSDPQRAMFLPTYSTGSNVLSYGNYSSWSNLWPSSYSGYAANPAAHTKVPPYGTGYLPQRPFHPDTYPPFPSKTTHKVGLDTSSSKSIATPARVITPPLPHPDHYRHWDGVLKAFLEKTKLTQCRRGFELDMLVLNSDWEQRMLPEALKDLVHGMQIILDRMSGNATDDTKTQPNTSNTTSPSTQQPLDERKLDYLPLKDGKKPELQSSVTKSISQFLARSRGRNDLSNHAEFLQTLAERKQAAGIIAQTSSSETIDAEVQEVFSCARVDAKTIDRAKQIKYDIMKNEDGPLTRTTSIKPPSSDASVMARNASESAMIVSSSTSAMRRSSLLDEASSRIRKRRRLADVEDNPAKTEPKATESQPPVLSLPQHIQDETSSISATLVPVIDERIRSIEDHLSVRYVPSPPQALLTRLKYLEDHLIRLEKEYPPWAALHFKQPNRGWPPPPRSTPIIIPPHLRSTNGNHPNNSTNPLHPPVSLPEVNRQPSDGTSKAKPRPKSSTLHKAVMDRLEIQEAMNEMGLH